MYLDVQELVVDDEEAADENHSQLRISCERKLSAASGLQLTATLSPDTPHQAGSLQDLCLSVHARHASALHSARLDIETNCSSASRATLEGSLQLGSSVLASATLGTDLGSSWLAQQRQQGHAPSVIRVPGVSVGAAAAKVSSCERRKVEAKWLAAEGLGQHLVLQAVQQLSQQHLLQLSASSNRDSSSSSSSSGCQYGTTWLECRISVASCAAEGVRLALGSRGSSRIDNIQQSNGCVATPATGTTIQQQQQQQQQQPLWHVQRMQQHQEVKHHGSGTQGLPQEPLPQGPQQLSMPDCSRHRHVPPSACWHQLQQLPVLQHLIPYVQHHQQLQQQQQQQQEHRLAGNPAPGCPPSVDLASRLLKLQVSSSALNLIATAAPADMHGGKVVAGAAAAAAAPAAAAAAGVTRPVEAMPAKSRDGQGGGSGTPSCSGSCGAAGTAAEQGQLAAAAGVQ